MKKYELQAAPVAFGFIMMPLERSYTQSAEKGRSAGRG